MAVEGTDVNGEDEPGVSRERLYVLLAILCTSLVALVVGLIWGANAGRWFFMGSFWAGWVAYVIVVVVYSEIDSHHD